MSQTLRDFTGEKSFADYEADPMLRAAVERQFEIIGEGLSKLAREYPKLAANITEYQRIIAFRNILIHGYADVDHRLVWEIVQTKLPTLREDVDSLLKTA